MWKELLDMSDKLFEFYAELRAILNQPQPGPGEYRCAMCRGIFGKGFTDEEANAEKLELWGDVPAE